MVLAYDPVIERCHHRVVDQSFRDTVTVQNVLALIERDGENALLASPAIV